MRKCLASNVLWILYVLSSITGLIGLLVFSFAFLFNRDKYT